MSISCPVPEIWLAKNAIFAFFRVLDHFQRQLSQKIEFKSRSNFIVRRVQSISTIGLYITSPCHQRFLSYGSSKLTTFRFFEKLRKPRLVRSQYLRNGIWYMHFDDILLLTVTKAIKKCTTYFQYSASLMSYKQSKFEYLENGQKGVIFASSRNSVRFQSRLSQNLESNTRSYSTNRRVLLRSKINCQVTFPCHLPFLGYVPRNVTHFRVAK